MLSLAGIGYVPEARAQDPVDAVINAQAAADRSAVQMQAQIDQAADRTQEKVQRYRTTLTQVENLRGYNKQLEQQVQGQRTTIEDLSRQLADIETTQQQAMPLMQKMIDNLEALVKADVPFLKKERTDRVENLKALMDMIQRRELKPVIDEVLPLERAAEGLRLIESREVFGKVVVTP